MAGAGISAFSIVSFQASSPNQAMSRRKINSAVAPSRPAIMPDGYCSGMLQVSAMDDLFGIHTVVVVGRFKADQTNELWIGETLHGPDRRPQDLPVRLPVWVFTCGVGSGLVGWRPLAAV